MSNLDDFFKKRDKKKKGVAKAKFSTLDTEELAKNLETVAVKNEETDPDFQDNTDRSAVSENLDEEWKPFDSEENKDYTGLRINTQTWNDEDEENEVTGVVDDNEKNLNCPWGASGKSRSKDNANNDEDEDEEKNEEKTNVEASEPKTIAAVLAENTVSEAKVEPAVSAPATNAYIPPSMRARLQAEAAAKPVETLKPSTQSSGGAYVPPSMRNRMGGTGESASSYNSYEIPTSSVNYRRANKSQPNFNDCLEFPSLDAAGNENSEKMNNGSDERFEYAKKSGRVEAKNEKDSQINLQNKFATLSSNN